jgi:hypothetical protein
MKSLGGLGGGWGSRAGANSEDCDEQDAAIQTFEMCALLC